jgi:hypothetical protein
MPLFEQGQVVQYDTLKHASVSLSTTTEPLPDPGVDWGRVRRVVVRNLGAAMDWQSDGNDPGTDAFRSLADEIVVLDIDFQQFRMKAVTGTVDVRIAYFGV